MVRVGILVLKDFLYILIRRLLEIIFLKTNKLVVQKTDRTFHKQNMRGFHLLIANELIIARINKNN